MSDENTDGTSTVPPQVQVPPMPVVSEEQITHADGGPRGALLAAAAAEDTSAALMSWPSKGVDFYAYLDNGGPQALGFGCVFSKPVDWGGGTKQYRLPAGSMQRGNLQIAENDIGLFEHTGRYRWEAFQMGTSLASRYAEIAPSTGNLGSTNLGSLLGQRSLLGEGWGLSYGFYDAGPGFGSLTNQDQSYVYLTTSKVNWMADLVRGAGASVGDKPFSAFVLPGAHDAGMFDPTCAAGLVKNAAFLALLAPVIGWTVAALSLLAPSVILRALINLSFTQKDNVTGMLNMGVRYFDYRPGYSVLGGYPAGIYHQHNFVPGYPYDAFLRDVLAWLSAHPGEIVVVSANFQGLASDSMKPTVDVLNATLAAARQATGTTGSIVPGDRSDLGRSYNQLLAARKRLIFLNQVGAANDASKYDSYSDAYQTTDVQVILDALNGMDRNRQGSYDYTVLQLQGTATGTGGGIFASIATQSDATSPLMSTKPGFDNRTYPWVEQNVVPRFRADKLMVLLNDFADNVMAANASTLTYQRAKSLPPV